MPDFDSNHTESGISRRELAGSAPLSAALVWGQTVDGLPSPRMLQIYRTGIGFPDAELLTVRDGGTLISQDGQQLGQKAVRAGNAEGRAK
jgi:hypothetical protein